MSQPISDTELESRMAARTAPRVTPEGIRDKIADVRYLWDANLCLCIIEMQNGFKLVGKSAPASPENFDAEIGKRYAYDDAFKQIWPLEGYLLRDSLHSATLRPDPLTRRA